MNTLPNDLTKQFQEAVSVTETLFSRSKALEIAQANNAAEYGSQRWTYIAKAKSGAEDARYVVHVYDEHLEFLGPL
tara:strand:- start:3 stop:230 length:228 start_codon:yes stop_codon:yes gene_type:complete